MNTNAIILWATETGVSKEKSSKDLKFPAEKAFAGHLRVPNPPFGMFL